MVWEVGERPSISRIILILPRHIRMMVSSIHHARDEKLEVQVVMKLNLFSLRENSGIFPILSYSCSCFNNSLF